MELEDGLLTRRSIRHFEANKDIPPEVMDDILRDAMYAPSAMNKRPWNFIVVTDKEKFKEIMAIHPYSSFLGEASAAVIVCGNLNEQLADQYWVVDCAAASQNLILGAHAKGLGGCWCGIFPVKERMDDFSKIFNLPEHIQPLSMIVLGYPSKAPKSSDDRFDRSKIHYDTW